jgi:SAM-dependent methyltransferase
MTSCRRLNEVISPAAERDETIIIKSQARIVKDKKRVSREIGIEIGAICGKHFLNIDHLHYGYWQNGLKVEIASLRTAQENYTNFLLSQIPQGIKTILDVGCGQGCTAKKLIEAGYEVDGVSPSPFLAEKSRSLLGNQSTIFECTYEQLETDRRYDLVLFSESFQYIRPEDAIEKTLGLLNEGGYILISDIFKTIPNGSGERMLSGGHYLNTFYEIISRYPLKELKNLDITEQTAPSIDIENQICKDVVQPVSALVQQLLENRHPLVYKLLRWRYKKKIDKIENRYFSGKRTAENFKKFKTYRVLLYKTAENI